MHCSHSRRQKKDDPYKMWRYNVGSRRGVACSLMSRETILQTKDLSSGRHPAPLKSPWENHWISTEKRFSLRGFNIHYYGWSILFNQEETWQAWLHLLGETLCMILGINTLVIFLPETTSATLMWTAREIDINSEIELSSRFYRWDELCVPRLFISIQLLPFPSFPLFSCIYCFIRPDLLLHLLFWASLLFLFLSVVCQAVSLWKLSDL